MTLEEAQGYVGRIVRHKKEGWVFEVYRAVELGDWCADPVEVHFYDPIRKRQWYGEPNKATDMSDYEIVHGVVSASPAYRWFMLCPGLRIH